jgi:enoyl-CoA hydratase/carnithine racemase
MAESDVLVTRVAAHVAQILVDRRESANALLPGTASRIEQALVDLEADPPVRVIVVRGAGGRAFCGGYDLSGVNTGVRDTELQSMLRTLRMVEIPTVAVLDGHAVGAGLDLAASCDLRVVRHGSRIGLPAVRIGVAYDAVSLRRMLAVVPSLRRILLTGAVVEATEVPGFADLVVGADRLEEEVAELCRSLALASPSSLAYMTAMTRPDDDFDATSARIWRDAILDGPDPAIAAQVRGTRTIPVFPDREPWRAKV